MDKQDFLEFVEKNILGLFTGSEIVGEEESTPRDACVALGSNGTVLIKFNKQDEYRFVIKRVQPFKTFEISIIKSVIDEMSRIYTNKLAREYSKQIEHIIIEKAICKSITSNYIVLQNLLSSLERWSMRTYEGNHTSFGFIFTNKKAKEKNNNLSINNFLYKDFSALLSDGKDTFMEISSDGFLTGYITSPKVAKEDFYAPYEYIKMAGICTGSKIGVCLLAEGDILLFKDRMLTFAKRGGTWACFTHQVVIDKMAIHSTDYEDVRRAVYLSSLDTSFNRCGGCIVHVGANEKYNVLKHINAADVLTEDCYKYIMDQNKSKSFFSELTSEDYQPFEEFIKEDKCAKTANLIRIIGNKKFQELNRKLRLELMGIDGATIVDHDGTILAVGAIIKIEAGSTGGGRLAAAKMLSNYGVAIKISNDGSIQGFCTDRNKLRVKPLFIMG